MHHHTTLLAGACLALTPLACGDDSSTDDGAQADSAGQQLFSYTVVGVLNMLLAPWLLGERVSLAAWAGIAGGFLGVLLVVRPSFDGVGLNAVMVLICALLVTSQLIINRKLGGVADPLVTSLYGAGIATLITTPVLPWLWQQIAVGDWTILIILAFTGAASQTATVMAFARTPASDLAPFTYTELISAIVFGWLIFGTLPDWISWAGIALISLSGIAVARAMAMRNVPRRVPRI